MSKETAFTQEQYDQSHPVGIEDHYWHLVRTKVIRDEIREADLTQRKFLEVGCGTGPVVKSLRRFNLNVTGVEISKVSADDEVKQFVLTGIDAKALDKDLRNSIEAILLLDVIEHIEDPVSFVSSLLTHFPNALHVIITVPARQELWSNYDTFFGHYRRYSLSTLRDLSVKLNCRIVSSRYFFHALYFPVRFTMSFSKRGTQVKTPRGILKLVHRFLAWGFYLDYKIMPTSLRGTSIINILRKE